MKPLKLFADHRQILVQDAAVNADLSDAWTDKAVEDCVAVAKGAVGLGTLRDEDVLVTVAVLDEAPGDLRGDHVTESSLQVRSKAVAVLGNMDHLPDAHRVAVDPGTWQLRASHSDGKIEKIRLELWPGRKLAPRVLKRRPPPAKPKSPKTGVKNAKQAAALARKGNTDEALEALLAFAASGDVAASASAAELLAFLGRWQDLVPHATALCSKPSVVSCSNVFTDLSGLLRRASRELGNPKIIETAAAGVPANMKGPRDATLLKDYPFDEPGEGDRMHYDAAVAEAPTLKRFKGKPKNLARHCFGLAVVYKVSDAIVERWDAKNEDLGFEDAVEVARVLAHRGDQTGAWKILELRLANWYPVDYAQVAPVVLLIDPWLSKLMTPERCRQVLSTPRGPEGA